MNIRKNGPTQSAEPLEESGYDSNLFEEPSIIVSLQLAFDLSHGVKRNTDHDQDRSTTERLNKLIAREVEQNGRNNSDQSDEDATWKGNTTEHVVDVLLGSLTRTDSRDEAALLLQILSSLARIEHHRGVEVGEKDDETCGKDPVHPTSGNSVSHNSEPADVEQRRKLSREVNQTASEDDRNNASSVHLERDVRGLTTHHPTALNTLGIVHGDTTLSTLNEDDQRDADQDDGNDQNRKGNTHARVVHRGDRRIQSSQAV